MRQTRLTIEEMEERARFGIFRNNVNEWAAWMACIQVCMRLEEMAAGQQPPPPAQVSQIPPGGHRGVYSITDLIDRLGALETRLSDHLDSHKRLFPGSLGPNPEDPRR